MYNLDWKENAIKQLEKLDPSISRRIFKAVEDLALDPFSKDIKKLKGLSDFRLRVGDYRIIFSISQNTITILKIGHRSHIYQR